MLDTARALYRGDQAQESPGRSSGWSYLKTTVKGRTVFLALGYAYARAEGTMEIWYSNSGEVVKLLNGRLAGTVGLDVDWRDVRFSSAPSWESGARTTQNYVRVRDMMPGYRFGVRDEVLLSQITQPKEVALAQATDPTLRWYEESSSTFPIASSLPAARFAVSFLSGKPQVVYSEQCISRELCMSFERYPASASAASGTWDAGR